jgi:PAS domain S-box-containing protein
MKIEEFSQKVEKWRSQVASLLQRTNNVAVVTQVTSEWPHEQHELLMVTSEELSVASEELNVAQEQLIQQHEELVQQNQELVAVREAVEAERQRYQELFELAPDGYLVTDVNGNIQQANRAAAKMFNLEPRFIVGKPLSIFIVREEHLSFYSQLTQLSRKQERQEWEVRLQPRNGTPFDAALTVAPVRDRTERCGKVVTLRWLLRDISDRKQVEFALKRVNEQLNQEIAERQKAEAVALQALEAEKALNELKSRFIGMISHEYRTPLTTILSSAELLERYSDRWTQEKKTQHLKRIQSQVTHLTQLVNDILFINQVEAQEVEVQPTFLDLPAFCQELVEDLKLTAKAQHKIMFESHGDCTQAYLDQKILRQILSNLLSNAIKYSPQGGTVRFECICLQNPVTFRIQDEGIGIPGEDLPQLMQSFYRATNVGAISGTGLGLAIVKKCVDLHGGQITVDSKIGVGTTFQVTLPLGVTQMVPSISRSEA